MDPKWLLDHFHTEFVWLSLVIVFVECGLFFPFLPGDTLLFAIGLFIATDQLHLNLFVALGAFCVSAFLGNVVGYEIGRKLGPPIYRREGRILKRKYLDQTRDFFDRHGHKALVIGRFVPFVRTYITLVAGITEMGRRRFMLWSAVGAVAWVLVITLLGYFLGQTVPWLKDQIDVVILGLLVLSVIPIAIEWWRHRGKDTAQDGA
jgi:membrane-associated protein